MVKQSIEIIKGYFIWSVLKWKEHLDYKKVVLVLTGENAKVDDYAIRYLDYVMERKSAEQALVLVSDENAAQKVSLNVCRHKVKTKMICEKKIERIFKWYCLDKFYKNLIFTYVRTNKDNLLERFLNETEINEEDIVCLALYNLRKVPVKEAGVHNV